MSKTLYVPDHVIAAKKATEEKVLASAYVNKGEKVLDPSLVSKNLKERLKILINYDDKAGEFYRKTFYDSFRYLSNYFNFKKSI